MGPDTFCPTKPRLSRESQNLLITPRVKAPGPWPHLRLLKPRLGALAPPVFPEAWALCRGWSRDVLQQGSFQMLPSMWREGEPPGLPSPRAPLQALESPKIRQVSSGLRRKSILSSPTFPEYPKNSPGKTTLLSIGQGKLKQLLYLTKNTSCCHDNLCSKIRNASHSGVAAIKRAAGKCLSIHQSSGGGESSVPQPGPPTLQTSFSHGCSLHLLEGMKPLSAFPQLGRQSGRGVSVQLMGVILQQEALDRACWMHHAPGAPDNSPGEHV